MKNKIFNIITLFSLVIFLNIITEYTNIQIDLTKDNLYSISKDDFFITNRGIELDHVKKCLLLLKKFRKIVLIIQKTIFNRLQIIYFFIVCGH